MTSDIEPLRQLAAHYARAVDQRDRQGFLDVFTNDGRLRVFYRADATEPDTELVGPDRLGGVVEAIQRFQRTFHFVGNSTYSIDGSTATGDVYCIAHHLTPQENPDSDYVMHIRYADTYRMDDDGTWRIATRDVRVQWTETRAIDVPS